MASCFYDKIAPDYEDGPNKTGERPGYQVVVVENDGGVGLQLSLVDGDPRKGRETGDGYRGVFFHVEDARELLRGLQGAIDRAALKAADHGWRTRDP